MAVLYGAFYGYAQQQKDSIPTALEEVVVQASSKFDLKRKDSGKPVIKITRDVIASQSSASLADLLNQYAGIEINGARSNAGQNLGYLVRGGSTRHTAFLINGAQVNDPSNISSEFDLRLIDLEQIEEIEILKGAASTLYGANASTAVVNIKLRNSPADGNKWSLSSSVGTNKAAGRAINGIDEFNNSIQMRGAAKNGLTYGLGFNHTSVDGLSAARNEDGGQEFDSDPFNRVNLLGRIGYDNHKDFMINSYLSFDEFVTHFDQGAFADADNETYNRQWRWGTNMNWKYSAKAELVYTDVSTHTRRDTRSSFPSIFNADGYSLDLYHKYSFELSDQMQLKTILGFNFRSDQYEDFSIPFGSSDFEQNADKDQANAQVYDPYANVVWISGSGLNINAGARYNAHSNYDATWVYNFNPSFRWENTNQVYKLYASYSTAYIVPSLFQLYAAEFGNEDLQPEENATLEAGLSASIDQASISVSLFRRSENQLVQFVTIDPANFISAYQNVDEELIARGIEVAAQAQLWDRWDMMANYTFTERDNVPQLIRIPKHKVNVSMGYDLLEQLRVRFRYQYNHQRADAYFDNTTFMAQQVELDAFQLVDLDFTYKVPVKNLQLFLGVSNILDEDYQELAGFQTRGRNYKMGVRLGL